MLWSQLGVSGPAGSQSTTQPTRNTSEQQLDQWNQAFRQSSIYQTFMRSRGLPTDGRVHLSDSQQEALERELLRAGIAVPKGMHIDAGGNLNQQNHLVRNVAIGAGITAAIVAPYLIGAYGGGGGAAAGAGAAAGGGGAAAGGASAAGLTAEGLIPTLGAGSGATGVGALGVGAGGALGGSAIAGTTGAVSGLGSAVAGSAGAAGRFPWSQALRYGVSGVGSVLEGYLGSQAAQNAAEIQNQAAQRGIDLINQAIPAERDAQAKIYGGVRSDLGNLYNQTAQTQGNLYNATGQSQANLYNATGQAQNQVYNQTAAAYQPYQSLGAGSLSNLSRMIGGGPIAAAPSFQPVGFQPVSFSPVQAPQFSASAATSPGVSTTGPSPQNAPVNNQTAPPAQNLEAPTGTSAPTTTSAPTPQAQAAMQTATSYAPGRLNSMASGPVRLRAPTGETMDFAPNDPNIQRALDQGAQRVA